MPQPDTITCKHCGEPLATILRAALQGRMELRCLHCGVVNTLHPVQRRVARVYTERQEVGA